MKLTLKNDYHGTSHKMVVADAPRGAMVSISRSQYARARRALCGISDCTCGTCRGGEGRLLAGSGEYWVEIGAIKD